MVTRDSLTSEAYNLYLNQKNESWRRMPKGLESEFDYVVGKAATQQASANKATRSSQEQWADEFFYQALSEVPYTQVIQLKDHDQFQWQATSTAQAAQHVLIIVDQDAVCELYEEMSLLQSLRTVDIHLLPGAKLTHYQILHPQQKVFDHVQVVIEEAANYQQLFSMVGGSDMLYRRAQRIRLVGKHSQASIQGGVVIKAKGHVQEHVVFEHIAPHTTSHHQAKSVVETQAKVDVYSEVAVANSAAHSVSRQYIHHLLLAETAAAFSKPALNIDIDEVDSQHGAVTGMIDDQLLFYMESRGIDKALAKQIYLKGYIQTCFEGYSQEQQKRLSEYLEKQLNQLQHPLKATTSTSES